MLPAQTATAAPSLSPRSAGVGELPDLSRETFSIAEAAQLLDHEECVMRLLCREGVVPAHEAGGELRIKRDDLMAHYRESMRIREHYRNSRFRQEMRALNSELMDAGLF